MKAKLIQTINSSPHLFKHKTNHYVVPNRGLYGDFLRSVELSYYTDINKLSALMEIRDSADYDITIFITMDNSRPERIDPDFFFIECLEEEDIKLFEWYEDKEDILHIMEELMSIFETVTGSYGASEYLRNVPALVYDTEKKDWVISDTELETIVVENVISSRESRRTYPDLTSPIPDFVFRIVQALHYFNNLVRAEKVPDWVLKIIDDYEVYRLLDA